MELSLEDLSLLEEFKTIRAIKLDKNYLDDLSNEELTRLVLLKELFSNLTQKQKFSVGDIVKWKRGLKNKKFPSENGFGVVVECLQTPIYNNKEESGSASFREPLDIVVGILNDDKSFNTFHYDSRRFRKVTVSS